jgi:HNH endonuclease
VSVEIPIGVCQCGCGGRTTLSPKNNTRDGYVKGEYRRYLNGHSRIPLEDSYAEEDRGHETPCWVWQRPLNGNGYGELRFNNRGRKAHAVFYERKHGEIPAGLELDHLCRVRACVNPDHLEPVTHAENMRRSVPGGPFAENAARTHCIHGHPFDEANTIIGPRGNRQCRECSRRNGREYQARKRKALVLGSDKESEDA